MQEGRWLFKGYSVLFQQFFQQLRCCLMVKLPIKPHIGPLAAHTHTGNVLQRNSLFLAAAKGFGEIGQCLGLSAVGSGAKLQEMLVSCT